eukprot:7173384-Prorocentrum_lima.AAC.1
MTSSLVGSEMCIRDRCEGPPRQGAADQLTATSKDASSEVPQQGGHTRPVSYTHLTLPTICSV